MTDKIRNNFLSLLRSSLWGCPLASWSAMSPDEWDELFEEAKKHTLIGVLYDALPQDSGIPAQTALNWLVSVRNIEKTNSLLKAVVEAQSKAWTKRGMNVILLKGQSVAKMYPHPEHRTSGDVDWYFASGDDWDIAREAALDNDCSPEMDSDGDVHYVLSGVVVEHHRRWNDASSARARAVFDALDPLSPIGQITMLSLHILKHALVGGIGLRQFCDLAMAYKYYDGQYSREELLSIYESAGLSSWNLLIEGMLKDLLDTPGLNVTPGYEADVTEFERIVLSDGNFGHYEDESSMKRLFVMMKGLRQRYKFFGRFASHEFQGRVFSLMRGRIRRTKI